MKDYTIATASTADLEREWLDAHGIPFISYTFTMNDEVYEDDCKEETKEVLYRKMREGIMPNTSQISTYHYEEFFRSLMQAGKDVIFADMSRAISVSIQNAEAAAKTVQEEFPDQRLYFLDSFCITGGLAMLIREMTAMKESGASFDEVVAWAEAKKKKIVHRFTVNDLIWLKKGGRLSNISAVVGTILSLKPLMVVDEEGKLVAFETVRGRKKALLRLVDSMANDLDPQADTFSVYHSDCEKDAKFVAEAVRSKYPQFKEGTIHTEGPVIGAHVGPDFIAVFYHGKERAQ
ncbi:MAG: DegV family protein [Lachnospiraceae bacterium]|nr:DegV family protein [Lachnospiraceae bacterium]